MSELPIKVRKQLTAIRAFDGAASWCSNTSLEVMRSIANNADTNTELIGLHAYELLSHIVVACKASGIPAYELENSMEQLIRIHYRGQETGS